MHSRPPVCIQKTCLQLTERCLIKSVLGMKERFRVRTWVNIGVREGLGLGLSPAI